MTSVMLCGQVEERGLSCDAHSGFNLGALFHSENRVEEARDVRFGPRDGRYPAFALRAK